MYTLHIANKLYSSWSMRPWVLMRELGLPFQESMHRFGDAADWAAYRNVAPAGKVPAWWMATLWCRFVEHRRVPGRITPLCGPTDATARAWARSAVAEMHSGFQALRQHCSMHCGWRVRLHEVPDSVVRDVERIQALWAQGLTLFGGPYLAGDQFTAVDAFLPRWPFASKLMACPSARLRNRIGNACCVPAVQDWVAQALREPEPDPAHEQDILSVGTVLQDLRIPPV